MINPTYIIYVITEVPNILHHVPKVLLQAEKK